MKKMFLIMAVLLLVAPAMAEVKIYCVQGPYLEIAAGGAGTGSDANLVTVYYDATSEVNLPRAFALDITLVDVYGADNAVVPAVIPGVAGESAVGNRGFGIFLGSDGIDINATTGAIEYGRGFGSPAANAADPCAASGIGTKAITVELGSLYGGVQGVGNPNAPAKSGVLCSFRVNNKACGVVITENARRGGIVMEDPDEVVDVNLPGTGGVAQVEVMAPGDMCGPDYGPRDGQCNFWDYYLLFGSWNTTPPTDPRTDICGADYIAPDGTANFWDYYGLYVMWNTSHWQ